MPTIGPLIDEGSLHPSATPAKFRLGKELATQGAVELLEITPQRIIAKVRPPGGQTRTVTLTTTDEGLAWKCT